MLLQDSTIKRNACAVINNNSGDGRELCFDLKG